MLRLGTRSFLSGLEASDSELDFSESSVWSAGDSVEALLELRLEEEKEGKVRSVNGSGEGSTTNAHAEKVAGQSSLGIVKVAENVGTKVFFKNSVGPEKLEKDLELERGGLSCNNSGGSRLSINYRANRLLREVGLGLEGPMECEEGENFLINKGSFLGGED